MCEACELRSDCTTSELGRQILRHFEEEYVDRVKSYRGTFPYEKALRKRRVWVEPLFAEAKDWHGLRKFRLRRLEKVNIEALLIASGQNIKRLVARERGPRKLAQVAALRPPDRASRCRPHLAGGFSYFRRDKGVFQQPGKFEMVGKKGMGLHSVSNRLMEQKIPAPEGGMIWHPKVLRGLVKKDVYLARPYDEVASLVLPKVAARLNPEKRYGIWWYGKMRHRMVGQKKIKTLDVDSELWVAVPVPDCGIDPELVLKARKAIDEHRGAYVRIGPKRSWELSGGFVLCAHCSNRMSTNTGRNGTRYYRCNRRARFGEHGCIGAKTMKADYLEAEVWRRVTTFMTHPELFQESLRRAAEARFKAVSVNPDRELAALMKRMSTLEKKRVKIEDLVIAEILTQERARFRLKELEEEIESVRARMEALKSARQKADLFEQKAREIQGWNVFQARQKLDLLSSEKRRALYASLDIAVFVDQKGEISVRHPLGTLEDPSGVKAAHGSTS